MSPCVCNYAKKMLREDSKTGRTYLQAALVTGGFEKDVKNVLNQHGQKSDRKLNNRGK